ncbi:MAG: HAD family hydrolase [Prevotellaceae bacterium]|nr:HAD family hydrolase [Prevotellaceae bacterium]
MDKYSLNIKDKIKVIAFDADDTLWDNETHFLDVENQMCELLSRYADTQDIKDSLFKVEMANMEDYGYGAVAFTMNLIENAIKISKGRVTANEILQISELGRTLLRLDAKPLDGVTDTLEQLKASGKYRLVVFTKGELLTQENKLKRSELLPYFDLVRIVSDKHETEYRNLCNDMSIAADELLMVGNSLKSDVMPALNIGAWAIHIPFAVTWQHEVIESFTHNHMATLSSFSEITKLI